MARSGGRHSHGLFPSKSPADVAGADRGAHLWAADHPRLGESAVFVSVPGPCRGRYHRKADLDPALLMARRDDPAARRTARDSDSHRDLLTPIRWLRVPLIGGRPGRDPENPTGRADLYP